MDNLTDITSIQHLPLDAIKEIIINWDYNEIINFCTQTAMVYETSPCADIKFWKKKIRREGKDEQWKDA